MKRIVLGLMFLCLYSTVLFASNIKDADVYYNRGVAKTNQQDYIGAIEDYNQAIKIDPKSADIFVNRGYAKAKLQDFTGAIQDSTKAIELNPKDVFAYDNRGFFKANLQDYAGAIEDYNQAIKINPKYAMAYHNRGVAKYFLNDKVGALKDLRNAGELGDATAYEAIKKIQAENVGLHHNPFGAMQGILPLAILGAIAYLLNHFFAARNSQTQNRKEIKPLPVTGQPKPKNWNKVSWQSKFVWIILLILFTVIYFAFLCFSEPVVKIYLLKMCRNLLHILHR